MHDLIILGILLIIHYLIINHISLSPHPIPPLIVIFVILLLFPGLLPTFSLILGIRAGEGKEKVRGRIGAK
jgi:hypothetical protein